ncbi:transporter substrate-binding domain-containing protein, partial [Desulfobacterales bacterium HSG16]|nr:transporter substrate-binding domain-containing protein [Desulfobacterales bacterium HSG16]
AGEVFAEKIVRITAGDWPPYLSSNLPHNGIAGRIITEAFAVKEIKVKFDFYPWKRAFILAKKGRKDGTAVWLKNSEREADFYYSKPVIEEKHVFFHLKSKPFDWQNVNDIKGKTLGGLLGFSYGEMIDNAAKTDLITIDFVSEGEFNFKKLLAKRIDLYPQELNVGYHTLQTMFLAGEKEQITHHNTPFLQRQSYLLLPKKNERSKILLKAFNEGLEILIKEDKIEQYHNEIREMKK